MGCPFRRCSPWSDGKGGSPHRFGFGLGVRPSPPSEGQELEGEPIQTIFQSLGAGLRNARAKGKRLGRPRKAVDATRIAALRAQGWGWKKIASELGVGVGTVRRIAQEAR